FLPALRHLSFFLNHPAATDIYTLSLHDALPILSGSRIRFWRVYPLGSTAGSLRQQTLFQFLRAFPTHEAADFVEHGDNGTFALRSEEHTSELQSRSDLVCRLLLEKKKTKTTSEY